MAKRSKPASIPGKDPLWYKNGVIYPVHVRPYCNSDANGAGDFRGVTRKLDYLQDLGITAIWLLPFYPSPLRDDGYDIADYYAINPIYGTLGDFKQFLKEVHQRGLFQSMRNLAMQNLRLLKDNLKKPPAKISADAKKLAGLESEILEVYHHLVNRRISAQRIRIHGEFHLRQVLYTGKDFVIIDFEGEPGPFPGRTAHQTLPVARCGRHDPFISLRLPCRALCAGRPGCHPPGAGGKTGALDPVLVAIGHHRVLRRLSQTHRWSAHSSGRRQNFLCHD